MSLSRRLAAGVPAAGVTILAALALGGTPAMATNGAAQGGYPAVMTSPDPAGTRGADTYGDAGGEGPDTVPPTATGTAATDDNRGNPGYGGESPATEPTPTTSAPTGNIASVPADEGQAETSTPVPSQTTSGAGVSSGSTLPLTGAPVGASIALGGLLVAGGATALWYTRRRRA